MSMHLIQELWEAVEAGKVPPRFLLELAQQHFSTLCPVCAEEFQRFQESHQRKGRAPGAATTDAVLREQIGRIQKEERAARRDVADLLATPAGERHGKILRARARYRGAAVVHGLLDEYWRVVYSDPRAGLRLADLSWTVAKISHGAARIHELVALTASCLGNAERSAGNLQAADRWFRHVRDLLNHEDVRALPVLAKIDLLEGALRKDQRRFDEAVKLLTRALTLYRINGLIGDAVRVLLNLGETHFARGAVKTATAKAREALLLVDRETQPQLYLCAQHNLALYLADQGMHSQAAEILSANGDLYQTEGDLWTTLHGAWLGGRICAGLGDETEAEQSFRSVREGFLGQGNVCLAALVCLDLALLYLKQKRLAEVKELAAAIMPAFEAQGVHREAMAAWLLFRKAAEQETETAAPS